MSKLDSVKAQLDYTLNRAMNTLDKAILLIPDDKLDWKPIEDAMSAAGLGIHIYQCALVHIVGILKGEFSEEDFSIIQFNPKDIKSASEIVDYGEKVKTYIKENLPKLTEEHMDKQVNYKLWGNVKMVGFAGMSSILEEVIHHRGQLCVYLRMLGIKPPFIYDIS